MHRLRLLSRVAFVCLFGLAAARGVERGDDEPRVWSAQLHLHGSFSEGRASIDSHAHEASELGVDVLWWSDHDFRIRGYQAVTRFGFEDWQEPSDVGEDWRARWRRGLNTKKLVRPRDREFGSAELVATRARSGRHGLLLRGRNDGPDWGAYRMQFTSSATAHQVSLSALPTVRLAVRPEGLGPDARAFVHVLLSEHAPHGELGIEQYALRYELGGPGTPNGDPATATVALPHRAGEWNQLALDLVADVRAAFDHFEAEDNVLWRLSFGVETRAGAQAEVSFDDLVVTTVVPPAERYARQRALLDEVGARYPDLVQLQGVEISHTAHHLNEFSVGTELLDYAAFEERVQGTGYEADQAFQELVTEHAFATAHAKGGLISYNHMFGVTQAGSASPSNRRRVLRELQENRALGADLLEVGYRDRGGASLADHLWVWDQLALAGVRLVGTGVSDSHGSPIGRWRGTANNFLSWIHADAPTKEALIEGLRRGRVFFGDIEQFDGTLDLFTPEGWRMGDEVFTDRLEVELGVRLTGLRGRATLVVLRDGERVWSRPLKRGDVQLVAPVTLPAGSDSSVRVELRSPDRDTFLLSNPIWFPRVDPGEAAGAGAEPSRTRIAVAGVESELVERVRVRSVVREDDALVLRADADDGTLVLDLAGFGAPSETILEGWQGEVRVEGTRLTLRGLSGRGALRLAR